MDKEIRELTKVEILTNTLNMHTDKFLSLKINVDFFKYMLEKDPKNEKWIEARNKNDIDVVRQEKLVEIIKGHLEQAKKEENKS